MFVYQFLWAFAPKNCFVCASVGLSYHPVHLIKSRSLSLPSPFIYKYKYNINFFFKLNQTLGEQRSTEDTKVETRNRILKNCVWSNHVSFHFGSWVLDICNLASVQDSPCQFRTLNHSRTKDAEMVPKLSWISMFAYI